MSSIRLNVSRTSRLQKRNFSVETFEDRSLLSVSSFLPPAVQFEVDPSWYEPTSLIVRLADEGASTSLALRHDDLALPSRAFDPTVGLVDDLFKVDLPAGIELTDALASYRSNPNVLYAEPNYRIRITQLPNDPLVSDMWSLENTGQTGGIPDADVDASNAWDVTTGSGDTVVAVIDTGVDYNHPDLAGNIWMNTDEDPNDGIDNDGNGFVDDYHGYDFINNDPDPMDDQGHGTHVAGTIGAVGDNGIGMAGLNWNVQLMALKFLGADGSGTTEDAIRSLDYARENGADIINASWGGDPYSQALFDRDRCHSCRRASFRRSSR